jgi:serine phosphatase RsbU (regulator of sigma subunit)
MRSANRTGNTNPAIVWGVATAALAGQSQSGDLHLVKFWPDGALVAAVDGLGHGAEAAVAAQLAVATLEAHSTRELIALLKGCHEALRRTRGVAVSVASFAFHEQTLTWLGVGNVEGVLLRADAQANPARETLMLVGGVVGYNLPALRAAMTTVAKGDTLVFATDGIRDGWAQEVTGEDEPQRIADRIGSRYSKGTDDALVLVARYRGGAP